jgi:large subunit ribosomal protein L14
MIQVGSKIKICDNSGVLSVKCFNILKKSYKTKGKIGDFFIGSIKKISPITIKSSSHLKKGDIVKCVIISVREKLKRSNYTLAIKESKAILVNSQNIPIGTKINSILFIELRKKKLYRILSLSLFII